MTKEFDQLQEVFPDGEAFELNGRKFFDPSWNKVGEIAVSDEMVVTYSDEVES
jgi:hypothetical protein